MDDNIVKFPGVLEEEAQYKEIQDLIEEDDSETIVLAYNDKGKFSLVASNPDAKEMLFQLELAKHIVINAYLNNGDMEF